MPRRFTVPVLLALAVVMLPLPAETPAFVAIAWADDDDDGGGGGGRGGGGGEGGRDASGTDDDWTSRRGPGGRASSGRGFSLGDLFRQRDAQRRSPRRSAPPARRVRRASPPPPAPPLPEAAQAEIVAFDLSPADLDTLVAEAYEVIETEELASFGVTMRRLRPPAGVTLADARAAVRALPSGSDADFNHYFRAEATAEPVCDGPQCPAFALIDWPFAAARENACGADIAIGMIDTGINAAHEAFAGSQLTVHHLSDAALDPSRAVHGTAIAAILIGHPDSRSPGLLPNARLVAVDSFHLAGADERADAFTLVEGLDHLVGEEVDVINLSLTGPANTMLERAIGAVVEGAGIVVTAAAGNAGAQAAALYPAAYDAVIAVTAVDRNRRVYRRAGRGPHIDLSAPGVDIWTAASIKGARAKTGTSFAVPFVSAAAALLLQEAPDLAPAEAARRLAVNAVDLGETGADEIFGAGLISLAGICAGAPSGSLID